jgi:polysaccharide biosynthesis protein PslH
MEFLYFTTQKIFPPNSGGLNVIYTFLKYFSKEVDLEIITPQCDETDIPTQNHGRLNAVFLNRASKIDKYLNPVTFLKFWQHISRHKPNTIIFHFPWYGWFFLICKAFFSTRICLHQQNVEFLRFKRMGRWWWPALRVYEKWVCEGVDRVIAVTPVDREKFLKEFKLTPEKVLVAPYGFDSERFPRSKPISKKIHDELCEGKQQMILFFGGLDYLPNREAVTIIRERLAPYFSEKKLPAKFVVAGGSVPKEWSGVASGPLIEFLGHRENIKDYLYAADIVIAPLISGSGIRTKIIEAIGCGKRVISTKVGAEGIDADVCGELLQLVSDGDWEDFARTTEMALYGRGTLSQTQDHHSFLKMYDGLTIAKRIARILKEA